MLYGFEETNNRRPSLVDNEYKHVPHGKQSLQSAMNRFVQAVETMDGVVMVPSRLKDMEMNFDPTNPNSALVKAGGAHTPHTDLHSFYTMLNAIQGELVRGPSLDENGQEKEDPTMDEHAKKVAGMFRHHLKGLFNVLHQLTEGANFLTSRYQEELDLERKNVGLGGIGTFTI